MPFLGRILNSPAETGANTDNDGGRRTEGTFESTQVHQADLHGAAAGAQGSDARQPNSILTPVLESTLQGIHTRLDTLDSSLAHLNQPHTALEHQFADFINDVQEIFERYGLRHPREDDSQNSSSATSSMTNVDEDNLPDALPALIVYLFNRINRLSALIQPSGYLFNHIDGLTVHVNRVATQANTITTNFDNRFITLTSGLIAQVKRIDARQEDFERQVERRFDHQAARFLLQMKRFASDLRAQIQEVATQSDQLTAFFNRLHIEDLTVQVRQHTNQLQETTNRLASLSENINQELENIRASTDAAGAAMPVNAHEKTESSSSDLDCTALQVPVATTIENNHIPKAPSPILDGPIPDAFVATLIEPHPDISSYPASNSTSTSTPATEMPPPNHHSPPASSSTFDALDKDTLARVMRNDIGLSRIRTSDDSYWAPRNMARRAAKIQQAATIAGSSLTANERARIFAERSKRAGIRISAPTNAAEEKERGEGAEAYASLDRFEEMLEGMSRASGAEIGGVGCGILGVVSDGLIGFADTIAEF